MRVFRGRGGSTKAPLEGTACPAGGVALRRAPECYQPDWGVAVTADSPFLWAMTSIDLQHEIRDLVESTVTRLGFELVAVEMVADRRGRVMRLSIDRKGGVAADHCALVSERISPLLDQADPVDGAFHLEVSSPGIDRPVQRTVDFERFVGRRLKLRLVDGAPRRRYTGQLLCVEDGEIEVSVDGTSHRLALETIERAHLVLTLNEYAELENDHDDQ